MATLLIFERAPGQQEQIELDVTERQGHERSANVTERSVEVGASISDHVRANQPTVTLEGWISNTPITEGGEARGRYQRLASGGASTLQFPSQFDRVRDCHETLTSLLEGGVLIDIVTSLQVYQQVLLRRYRVDRDATTGSVLPLVLEIVQPRLVETRTVTVPEPAERRGRGRRNRGGQAGQTLDGSSPRRSAAVQLAQSNTAVGRAIRSVTGGLFN